MELTTNDIDVLIDAVEAWEREPGHRAFGDGVISAIVSGLTKGAADEAIEKKIKPREAEHEQETALRKRKGILLKAKLVELRDKAFVDEAFPAKG